MKYKVTIPILPLGKIVRSPGFQSKLVTIEERSQLEKMLLEVEEVYERDSKTQSPDQACRIFHTEYGAFAPGTGKRFVEWCKLIVEASQLNPDAEWHLRAEVRAIIEPHLVLIRTVASRAPGLIKSAFDAASEQAEEFCTLVGINPAELQNRVEATISHLEDVMRDAEMSREEYGVWIEFLRIHGIEV